MSQSQSRLSERAYGLSELGHAELAVSLDAVMTERDRYREQLAVVVAAAEEFMNHPRSSAAGLALMQAMYGDDLAKRMWDRIGRA